MTTEPDKIQDITKIIDHLNDCIRDLANGIDVHKDVIIGAAEDEVTNWDTEEPEPQEGEEGHPDWDGD